MDRDKINKAFDSFVKGFDDKNLAVANQEVQDLISIAQLNPSETKKFMERIRKYLGTQSVMLDSVRFV